MNHSFVFAPRAEHELVDILAYSEKHFGIPQTIVLKDKLERVLSLLCNNHEVGHVREDLSPPNRLLRYHTVMKRFCIVYEPGTEPLRVVRILHGRLHAAMQLQED